MSRIKANQRLTLEEFPDQKDWIGPLISYINDLGTQTINILNDGIIFPDNYVGKDHVFEFVYQSDAITFPIGFQWNFLTPPGSLVVASATEDFNPVNVSVSWKYTDTGLVQLVSVVRFTSAPAVALLQANKRYRIRCRVTP